MSYALMRDVVVTCQWLYRERDGAIAYRVLEAMALLTRDDNPPLYFGGRKRIAAMLGVHPNKVTTGLAVLEKHGLIRRLGPGTVSEAGYRRHTHAFELHVGGR